MPPRKGPTQVAPSTPLVAIIPPPTMKRNSGGKRTLDEAQSTDIFMDVVTTTNLNPMIDQPPAKKKVTYALPHQNMEEGHFYVVLGEDIDVSTQRFKILSLLGEGTFGKVVEAWDRKRKEYCAVKIVRSIERYTRDALFEIRFMEGILRRDPTDRFCLSRLLRYFENDSKNCCIVMPKYGPDLLQHIRRSGPLPYRHLAEVIFQCGAALDFLHSDMRLMHTDLKLENILLESSESSAPPGPSTNEHVAPHRRSSNPHAWAEYSASTAPFNVRVCDLGGCCDERHSSSAIVSTRHYRSPEVILGLGWMFSTDLWSMGCIIYELATGRLLYDTHDNLEHLHLMEKTLSKLPAEWAKTCNTDLKEQLFVKSSDRLRSLPSSSAAKVARTRPIHDMIGDASLVDLIRGCLSYDPNRRLTARQMMTHPFVAMHFPQSLQHPNHPDYRPMPLHGAR